MASYKGKIIAISSAKGGVGKTTLSLNLAGTFCVLKKKTLIIDLCLSSGNIAVSLNLKNDVSIYNLVDDMANNRYQDFSTYVEKYNEYIDVLCAPKDPRLANKIDYKYLELILNSVKTKYDVIILDTSHILDSINITSLDFSDTILHLLTNDPLDIKNTKSIIAIFKDIDKDIKVILNDSLNNNRDYFSHFDIKNIIKHNIDFTISKSFHIKNIDSYILDGEILILNKSLSFKDKKDYDKLLELAKTLIKGDDKHE
ncbi:MAG: AAA family ATPase [Bacilli bacterium]